MRAPKLNALRVFNVAARHLNFGAAADALNVTQGAVAQSIRGLEADLGVTLFKRLPRGVKLTDVGRRYHEGIAQGLAMIDHATSELAAGAHGVTISVPPSFASKWLVRKLPYFLERFPDIEVHTVASEAVTDFQAQNVDVAVRQGIEPIGSGLVVRHMAPMDLQIVCAPSLIPEQERPVDIEWCLRQPLVQDSHKHWFKVCAEHGQEPFRPFVSFNQTALAIDAAIRGLGFAIVPKLIAEEDVSAGRLKMVRTLESKEPPGFWVVHRDNRPPNGSARAALVDWLLKEAE